MSDWPEAPDADEKHTPVAGPCTGPLPEPLPSDPFSQVDGSQFHGTLAYTPWVAVDAANSFRAVVLRSVGFTKKIAGKGAATAWYGASPGEGDVTTMRFSPDGRFLAYGENHMGASGPHETHCVYLWDMKGKRRFQITPWLFYAPFFWSPNSRMVAYVEGGNDMGEENDGDWPLQLKLYDLATGKSRLRATHLLLSSPFWMPWQYDHGIAWTQRNTLLFSRAGSSASWRSASPRPSIYEVPAAGGEPKRIVPAAFAPAPSPDGKWIACFGWPDDKSQAGDARKVVPATEPSAEATIRAEAKGAGLYLFHRSTGKRLLLGPLLVRRGNGAGPSSFNFRWTPDSRLLVLLENSYAADEAGHLHLASRLSTWDTQAASVAASRRDVATLHLEAEAKSENFQFEPMSTSMDGKYLFLQQSKYLRHMTRGAGSESTSVAQELKAVSLSDGTVLPVARFNYDARLPMDWDWRQEPPRK